MDAAGEVIGVPPPIPADLPLPGLLAARSAIAVDAIDRRSEILPGTTFSESRFPLFRIVL